MAGMKNIYGMTKPLGYFRGGPAGAPELDEGYDPVLKGYGEAVANINNPEYINKWNMTKPRQPGLDEKLMQDYEPPIPRWGKAKDLGKKVLEGIGELFGGREAESATLMDTMDEMKESLMKYEILDDHIGKRPPMSIIREIDNLTGEALMDAYIEYGGTKYR